MDFYQMLGRTNNYLETGKAETAPHDTTHKFRKSLKLRRRQQTKASLEPM
jgi:hypothetical protein